MSNESNADPRIHGASDTLLIAGDSHINSFGIPLSGNDADYYISPLPQLGSNVFVLAGSWPRRFDAYWNAVQENAAGRTVAAFWGGNVHLGDFLFESTPPFDFVTSADSSLTLDESVEILPEEAIRSFFFLAIKPLKQRLKALKSAAKQVLIPGTPPPKEDDSFIRERFHSEPHFVKMAAEIGLNLDEIRLSPPILRLKLWMTLQELYRDIAEETGAIFVPVPPDAKTASGFLHPSCYANDVTHANPVYGKIMFQEMRKFFAPALSSDK